MGSTFVQTLLPVRNQDDCLPEYRNTPVEELLAYHNLRRPYRNYSQAAILIGTCMDYRIALRVPDKFAYILRAAGANLRGMEFMVSYAVAIGGVQAICLIGHDECGMVDVLARRDAFVSGLVETGGWERKAAEGHFARLSAGCEVRDSGEFVRGEARRLRERYPRVTVAPLFYRVCDGLLYQIAEAESVAQRTRSVACQSSGQEP